MGDLPVGLNPRVDRAAAQKFFVERSMHENPTEHARKSDFLNPFN
jgi:hypothetical protein